MGVSLAGRRLRGEGRNWLCKSYQTEALQMHGELFLVWQSQYGEICEWLRLTELGQNISRTVAPPPEEFLYHPRVNDERVRWQAGFSLA